MKKNKKIKRDLSQVECYNCYKKGNYITKYLDGWLKN